MQTHRGGHVTREAEVEVMWPQAKDTRSHQKLEEMVKDPPPELLGLWALLAPQFQILGLQSHETIISGFSAPRLWPFVWQPLGSWGRHPGWEVSPSEHLNKLRQSCGPLGLPTVWPRGHVEQLHVQAKSTSFPPFR